MMADEFVIISFYIRGINLTHHHIFFPILFSREISRLYIVDVSYTSNTCERIPESGIFPAQARPQAGKPRTGWLLRLSDGYPATSRTATEAATP